MICVDKLVGSDFCMFPVDEENGPLTLNDSVGKDGTEQVEHANTASVTPSGRR